MTPMTEAQLAALLEGTGKRPGLLGLGADVQGDLTPRIAIVYNLG